MDLNYIELINENTMRTQPCEARISPPPNSAYSKIVIHLHPFMNTYR